MSTEPPFRFTRESRIRIDADGHVWHEGERIARRPLERALASWVDFDDEARRYVLRNAYDWCWVTVDRAPLVVKHAWVRDEGVEIELNDEQREMLDLATVRVAPDGETWAYARGGTLLARFDRSAAFALLDHATLDDTGAPTITVGARTFALGLLADGERLPPRPGGPFPVQAPST